jgi:hypothetical protein
MDCYGDYGIYCNRLQLKAYVQKPLATRSASTGGSENINREGFLEAAYFQLVHEADDMHCNCSGQQVNALFPGGTSQPFQYDNQHNFYGQTALLSGAAEEHMLKSKKT